MADFPSSITSLTNPTSTDPMNNPSHADQHTNANNEIVAIETELGVNPAGASATVVARLDANDTAVALNTLKVTNATHTGDVTGATALTIANDAVDEEHINWGTGASQVSAADMPIADAGAIITATDVEGALAENRTALNLNTTHRTSNGSDHSYIDQDVTSGSSPTFTGTNITAVASTAANAVDDTMIDWGTGAGQVSAADVPIADAGGLITATDVEGALAENRTAIDTLESTVSFGNRGTFVDGDLSSGVLTITHSLGLSTPFTLNLTVADNSQKQIIPDDVTFATNTITVDLTSYGTLTGTWGYYYI